MTRVAGLALLGLLVADGAMAEAPTSLLFNPGPRFSAGFTMTTGPDGQFTCRAADASGAARVGNPAGWCRDGWTCADGSVWRAENGACPSYLHDFQSFADQDYRARDVPSWEMTTVGGGNGLPASLEHRYDLRTYGVPDPCTYREGGLVHHKWAPEDGRFSFKANPDGTPIRLGQFRAVTLRARVRLDAYAPARYDTSATSIQCPAWPAAFVTADIRVQYLNRAGARVRLDVLGLHLWELPGSLVGHPVSWADGCRTGCPLRFLPGLGLGWAQHVSGAVSQLTLGRWADYRLDVMRLLGRWAPPPAGYTVEDATVAGFDLYAHVRGSDIAFSVSDVDLVGEP